jgi:Sulfotransferase domain
MPPLSGRELVQAVRARSLPHLKSLRNRLAASQRSQRLTVFVAGVHRSGTNMMMEILERNWETDVFNEADSRAFDDYIMRDEATIKDLVNRSAAPIVVVKALHEAHDLLHLMDAFAPTKAIWMFRSYPDVVNSSLHHWPPRGDGCRNKIDAIVRDRAAGEWRGLGMTDETHRMLCEHYRPGLDDASAEGLFWVYRNQLFFDQRLDRDPRVLLVSYEDLVNDDGDYGASLCAFLGLSFTRAMRRIPFGESARKRQPPPMDAGIRALCDRMQHLLEQTHANQADRRTAA